MFGLFDEVFDAVFTPVRIVAKTVRLVEKSVCNTVDEVVGLEEGTTQSVADIATVIAATHGIVTR